MHRFSGMDNPEAPIDHHWLDSTHITYGVTTAGYVWRNWKVEGSAFNGREPDQFRWNFDEPRLDSYSGRLTYNPAANWSLQASHAYIQSPEQLEPSVNQHRTTASVMYNLPWANNNWQTTLAWGRNNNSSGHILDAVLLESAVRLHDTHTFLGRIEQAQKDELFISPDPQASQTFNVGKLSLGYIYDMPMFTHAKIGVGGLASLYVLPANLDSTYGSNPVSFMLFIRTKID
jgi:hypothetical protein